MWVGHTFFEGAIGNCWVELGAISELT